MSPKKRTWEGTTGGGRCGQRFLFWILNIVKVPFLYPILWIIIPFYLLFGRKGYRAIYSYFRIHHKQNKWNAFRSTYNNHLIFGKVVLDKFALLAGNYRQFCVEVEGEAYFNNLIEQEKGFVIASAHIGNFELIGHCFKQNQKKINGIIFGGESKEFQNQRIKSLQRVNIQLIPISEDMSHLFAIKEAIEKGEVISMPCDRIHGSSKHYTTHFFEAEAMFPIGTFRLAAQLDVPMLAIFVMKTANLRYQSYIYQLQPLLNEKSTIKKAEFLAQQYIDLLENTLKKYPEQWFNYYDFWKIKKQN